MSPTGRFAPSPSADLHIGNLRTAVLAWLFARSTGRRFLIRVDDLDDRTYADIGNRQLDDLAAIGVIRRGARVADRTHRPVRRGDQATVAPRSALRMLLQPKGYRAGTAGTACATGCLSGDMPRPHRQRP